MRIGFVVNDVAHRAGRVHHHPPRARGHRLGHETWLIGVDDFAHRADGIGRRHTPRRLGQEAQSLDDVPRERPGPERHGGTDHGRRPRRPDDAQRSGRRRDRAALGRHVRRPVRPAPRRPRHPRRQRSVQPRQRGQQDVLPALPRSGPPADADLPRPRRNRRVRATTSAAAPCSSRCRARAEPASSSCRATSRRTSTR